MVATPWSCHSFTYSELTTVLGWNYGCSCFNEYETCLRLTLASRYSWYTLELFWAVGMLFCLSDFSFCVCIYIYVVIFFNACMKFIRKVSSILFNFKYVFANAVFY